MSQTSSDSTSGHRILRTVQSKTSETMPVSAFYEQAKEKLKLELVEGQEGMDRLIREKSINRPALAITGYFKHFGAKRLQLFGAGEMAYVKDMKSEDEQEVLQQMVKRNIPCIVISRNLLPTKHMITICKEHKIPLMRSSMKSKDFMTEATLILEDHFAPVLTVHGTIMDIKGIGTLLHGKSGVGKSECALALIERGHSIVADDHAYVRILRDSELIARGSELNRGYMECRGLGIINIADLFGIRSIRLEKRIDLIVTFVEWEHGIREERTGLERDYYDIEGVKVPHMEIPVRPGRDMARLVEVAAMVQALRMMGHDSAEEFNQRLIDYMSGQ